MDALNHALRGIPAERIRYHLCFGSWHVPHVADAPLDAETIRRNVRFPYCLCIANNTVKCRGIVHEYLAIQ